MIIGPKWNDKFSVHVPEIDEQHKKLFAIINKAIDVYEKRSDDLISVIRELVDYVGYHFRTELHIMAEYDYPSYGEHSQKHAAFSAKVVELVDKIESDPINLSREIIIFLKDWLLNHILNTDQNLGKFLSERMAKKGAV